LAKKALYKYSSFPFLYSIVLMTSCTGRRTNGWVLEKVGPSKITIRSIAVTESKRFGNTEKSGEVTEGNRRETKRRKTRHIKGC